MDHLLRRKQEESQTSQEKIGIAIIAAPKDAKYLQSILTAIEGSLRFSEEKKFVSTWHKGLIPPGSVTAQVAWKHIQAARIILLLMSPYLLTDPFYNGKPNYISEISQRSKSGNVRVIPVLISPSSWEHSPFSTLEPLPANKVPLSQSSSKDKDKAIQDIAEFVLALVRKAVESFPVEMPSLVDTGPTQEKLAMPRSTFVHGHALLVGTGGNLPVTVDDAQKLGQVLNHSARAAYPSEQVDILLDSNATRAKILAAFDRLIQRVSHDPDATVIIYFSGHGGKFSRTGQSTEYFLIPHSYNPSRRRETAISDQEFTAQIEKIQARKLVVLLDCCFAGGIPMLKDVGERFEKSSLPPTLLQALASGEGKVVVASSYEGEESQADAQGSAFTNCLLEALHGKGTAHFDKAIRILDVLSYLFREVPRRTNDEQHPFVNRISNMDENFVLCYSQIQKDGVLDSTATPYVSDTLTSPTTYQRERLEKRHNELQSSLERYDAKITLLSQATDTETDVLRKYQYQQQLLQELRQRSFVEEELGAIIQQLNV